jgi:hypothetical protein
MVLSLDKLIGPDDIAGAMRPAAVYPGMPALLLLSDASAFYGSVIDEQHDDRTDHCDEHTVEIKSGNSGSPDHAKDKAANNRSDYPENDIENHTLARFVDNFARDETSYQTQDQPTNDRHDEFSFLRSMQRQPPNTTKILTLAAFRTSAARRQPTLGRGSALSGTRRFVAKVTSGRTAQRRPNV